MARVAFEVDREKLEAAIVKAESGGELGNLSILADKVASLYNSSSPPRDITPSVVKLRITEWGIVVKTKPGKRGRGALSEDQKAAMQAARGKRVPRGEKFAKNSELQAGFDELRKEIPPRFLPLVDRMQAGSQKAAIVLHCLDCVGYSTSEVRHCSAGVQKCAMWPFRPYQKTVVDDIEENIGLDEEQDGAS